MRALSPQRPILSRGRGRRGQRFPASVRRRWVDPARRCRPVHPVRAPVPPGRRVRVVAARRGTASRRAAADGSGYGWRAPPPPHRAAARPGAARAGVGQLGDVTVEAADVVWRDHHVPQRGAGGPQRARPAAAVPTAVAAPVTLDLVLDPRCRARAARRGPPRAAPGGPPIATPRIRPGRTGRGTPSWGWVGLQPEITTTAAAAAPDGREPPRSTPRLPVWLPAVRIRLPQPAPRPPAAGRRGRRRRRDRPAPRHGRVARGRATPEAHLPAHPRPSHGLIAAARHLNVTRP